MRSKSLLYVPVLSIFVLVLCSNETDLNPVVERVQDSFKPVVTPSDTAVTENYYFSLRVHADDYREIERSIWFYDGRAHQEYDSILTLSFSDTGLRSVSVVLVDTLGTFSDTAQCTVSVVAAPLYVKQPRLHGMRLIPAAESSFVMGRNTSASVTPMVTFSEDFYIDTTEVTQARYYSLMNETYENYNCPDWTEYGSGDNYPVYYASWYDAALYCNARSKEADLPDTVYSYSSILGAPGEGCQLENLHVSIHADGYRLPTEAEWEYACRAGTQTPFYWGDSYFKDSTSHYYAWYINVSDGSSHPVSQKLPNAFDLYDMAGGVYEWCGDWYAEFTPESKTDPIGPSTGKKRVFRGGSWNSSKGSCNSGYRRSLYPSHDRSDIGFRTVYRP